MHGVFCSSKNKPTLTIKTLKRNRPPSLGDIFLRGSMIQADIHTHTHYFHGRNTVEEMYKSAQKKNLKYYGFSEHTPLPDDFSCLLYRKGDMHKAFADYACDVVNLKNKATRAALIYPEDSWPTVLFGMELDFTPKHLEYMDTLIESHPFDYIIGTVHFIDSQSIALWDHSSASKEETFLFFEQYYQKIAELAKWGKADIIAHPDFVKIHCVKDFAEWLETKHAQNCVEQALYEVRAAGMVLEVSTGGLKKTCKEIHPAPRIMEIAAKLGLAISFSSDSHNTETVAYAFDELAQFASSYGYKQHVIFEKRIPKILDF